MRAQSHLFGGLTLLSGAWAKVKYLGVAIPGIDFGCDIDGSCPPDQAQYPSASHGHGDGAGQMKHFVEDSGLNTFRLPMTWQYILNEQVGGKLDDDKFGLYDDLMQSCLDTGAYCMIDLHNFARYDGEIIGQGGPSDEDFADVWSQLATKYAKEDKVMFGLMNEPHDLDVALWAKSCQAAVTSIRKAGATSQLILLPGTNFTNAETFVSTGSADALAAIKNPDGSKDGLILDLHKYLDINNSGSFDECTTDNVEAFRAMADWLRDNERVAIISESGASLSDSCMEKFCAQNEFIAKNSDVFIGFVGWGAGSFKYDYIMTLTPFQDGDKFTDNKLMKQCIIEPFIKNAPSATTTTSKTKTKATETQTTHTKPTKSTDSESSTTESSDSSSTTEESSSPSQPIFKEGSESAASRDSKPDDDSGASRSMGLFLGGLIKSARALEPCDRQNEFAALKDALLNGLDPNTRWEEDDLVEASDDDSTSNNSASEDTTTSNSVADDSTSNDSFENGLTGENNWPHWNTPLHRALRCSDFDSASLLIQHGADVNLCNYDDLTPLQEAVKAQRVEVAEYLVKNGADVDKGEAEEEAPLQIALSIGAYEIFRLLVKAVANFSTPSYSQWTILDLAVLARDQEALEILLDCSPGLKPSPLSTPDNSKGSGEWTDNVTAKELLGVVSSNRLIPPQEFYEVYSHAILSTWYSKNLRLSTASIKTFLDGVFEGLYEAAGMTIPTTRTTSCQPCSSFQARIANVRTKERYNEPLFPIHDTRSALDECAKHCQLCALAAEGLDHAMADAAGTPMYDNEFVDLPKLARSLPSSSIGFRLRYEKASKSSDYHYRYNGCKRDHSYLTVVDASTGAMNDLALVELDEKFVLEPSACVQEDTTIGSAPALSVVWKWLDDCRNMFSHELCRKAYQHVGQTRPARVLDLTEQPRLIDGTAMEGPYCSLSYCWGESGVNTLTTQANLAQHMKGIPVDSLPIFIRESIHAARSLGYKYLWIDAPCIVQDDEEDWGHEASRMSDIYSNSDLTISSLKAKDCDENLFWPRQIKAPHPLALDYWLPKQQRAEWTPGVVHQYAVHPWWTLG
ncbi:glycoside hydrolase family 5, partial [Fusarium albosuccineum]